MPEELIKAKMREWSEGYDLNNVLRIDRKYVHKAKDENNFVSRTEMISHGDMDVFLSQVAVDPKHPYFFEHEYDHIPGLLMVEAGRQIGTAVAHLFYKVDYDIAFVLNEMTVRFFKYVELNKPLFLRSQVRNKLERRGKLMQMEHDGYFIQDMHEVAYMSGTWQMIDKRIIQRFRRSAQNFSLTIE